MFIPKEAALLRSAHSGITYALFAVGSIITDQRGENGGELKVWCKHSIPSGTPSADNVLASLSVDKDLAKYCVTTAVTGSVRPQDRMVASRASRCDTKECLLCGATKHGIKHGSATPSNHFEHL